MKSNQRFFQIIRLMLALGFIHSINSYANPLHDARNVAELEYYLKHPIYSFKINSRDENGETPLLKFLRNSRYDMAKVLIDRGADVNATVDSQISILTEPVPRDREIQEVDLGKGPLHFLSRITNIEFARYLTDHHAIVDLQDSKGKTPLHYACEEGNVKFARFLIDQHADVNLKSAAGNTALHFASIAGSLELVLLLIYHNADVNIENSSDHKPLYYVRFDPDGFISRTFIDEMNRRHFIENREALLDLREWKKTLRELPMGRERYEYVLAALPAHEMYKLFIDRGRLLKEKQCKEEQEYVQKYGDAYLFDLEEPGYFKAMMQAFEYLSRSMDQPLSIELIQSLHDIAVGGVLDSRNPHRLGICFERIPKYGCPGEVMDEDSLRLQNVIQLSSQFIPKTLDEVPLAKLKDGYVISNLRGIVKFYFSSRSLSLEDHLSEESIREAVSARFEPEFEIYHRSIAESRTDREKLIAMGVLLRKLEMAHLFNNGNQRTYSFLLLNRLLIENGFPMAILSDPFLFDGYRKYTPEIMGLEIEKGILNFLKLTHNRRDQNGISPDGRKMFGIDWIDSLADLVLRQIGFS